MLPHERAQTLRRTAQNVVHPADLPLAMAHLSRLLAVLLDRSRSVPSYFSAFPLSQPGCHMPPTPTQRFFGVDSLTSKFSFARSEHGLRDGSGIPQPDTRKRAPILAF